MADEETAEITEQDVDALETKLIAFAETLPDGEQTILLALVDRAVSGGEGDVQGYCARPHTPGPIGTLGLKTVFVRPRQQRPGRHHSHRH
ncbi:MAG: hypothetical protein HYU88_03990 [Chloroflexi bacterium]|nr:hypothetical protein [Chloroflexota bacterium]